MPAHEIIVAIVERCGGSQIVHALTKPIGEAREAAHLHSGGQMRPLDVARADLNGKWLPRFHPSRSTNTNRRRVPTRPLLLRCGVPLYDGSPVRRPERPVFLKLTERLLSAHQAGEPLMLAPDDLKPGLVQKAVDMRIGLDVTPAEAK